MEKSEMFKKFLSLYISFAAFCCFSEINVGPAINNLNGRVFVLENKTTVDGILAMGFITNETDRIALSMIGNMEDLNTGETNLVLSINIVNDKASYPIRLYGGVKNTVGTNTWLEFSGSNLSIFANGVYSTTLATSNDLENILSLILNNTPFRDIETSNPFISVYSNKIYKLDTGLSGLTFSAPEGRANKENKLTVHLYKNTGNVVWFPNITWIYGEEPKFEVSNTNYVFQFESLDGTNWRGWIEYIY